MRRRAARAVLLATILGATALALALAFQRGWLWVPPEWSPWAAVDLESPPSVLTRYKLSRLSADRDRCEQVLADADMVYRWLPDTETGRACGVFDAVTIDRTTIEVGEPFSLTCRAAVSLALWETHVLHPAAQAHFGVPVDRIEHFGSYSCRNVYGRPNATRSRHATAEAFDVAGFVLADGRRIRVLGDWGDESPEAEFLRDVRDGACRFFDGVLSPDYNDAHRDHFHFDRGPYRICR